jgi:hypothetical protein
VHAGSTRRKSDLVGHMVLKELHHDVSHQSMLQQEALHFLSTAIAWQTRLQHVLIHDTSLDAGLVCISALKCFEETWPFLFQTKVQ